MRKWHTKSIFLMAIADMIIAVETMTTFQYRIYVAVVF